MEHPRCATKYLEKYDVKILDFTHNFPEEDGIVEPGETGFISTLTLYNDGEMPSPVH